LSHVNSAEAYLIDNYGELGEATTQTIGSGTINPATGLKEYNETYQYSGDEALNAAGMTESEMRKTKYNPGGTVYIGDPNKTLKERYDKNAGGIDYTSGLSELQADDPNIAMMDKTSRMMMMQDILKYERGVAWDNTRAQQWFNLLPTYDFSAEQDLRTKTGEQISQYGISAQNSLLNLARQQDLKASQRGYAMTGEPTIDRNRENIFADISDKSTDIYENYRDKQQSLQDQFSQDWATKMADLVAS
jgi:hypothetical protein